MAAVTGLSKTSQLPGAPARRRRHIGGVAWRVAQRSAAYLAVTAGALVFAEGIASTVVASHDILVGARRPTAERWHTKYDSELGWVNIPRLRIPDMYGAGRSLVINRRAV